jgi:hypothetical protein
MLVRTSPHNTACRDAKKAREKKRETLINQDRKLKQDPASKKLDLECAKKHCICDNGIRR